MSEFIRSKPVHGWEVRYHLHDTQHIDLFAGPDARDRATAHASEHPNSTCTEVTFRIDIPKGINTLTFLVL